MVENAARTECAPYLQTTARPSPPDRSIRQFDSLRRWQLSQRERPEWPSRGLELHLFCTISALYLHYFCAVFASFLRRNFVGSAPAVTVLPLNFHEKARWLGKLKSTQGERSQRLREGRRGLTASSSFTQKTRQNHRGQNHGRHGELTTSQISRHLTVLAGLLKLRWFSLCIDRQTLSLYRQNRKYFQIFL